VLLSIAATSFTRQPTVRWNIKIVDLAWTTATRCCMASRKTSGLLKKCAAVWLLKKLQSIKIAASRLVTGMRRRDHIMVLRELHWLLVRQRIKFEVACLAFKSLAGQVLAYLSSDCHLVSGLLQSADSRTYVVPRTHNRLGNCSFSVSGPQQFKCYGTLYQRNFIKHTSNLNTSNPS